MEKAWQHFSFFHDCQFIRFLCLLLLVYYIKNKYSFVLDQFEKSGENLSLLIPNLTLLLIIVIFKAFNLLYLKYNNKIIILFISS